MIRDLCTNPDQARGSIKITVTSSPAQNGIDMSWRNIKQTRLADALLIDHAALTELDGVHDLITGRPLQLN
jgi:hypothetical protein